MDVISFVYKLQTGDSPNHTQRKKNTFKIERMAGKQNVCLTLRIMCVKVLMRTTSLMD